MPRSNRCTYNHGNAHERALNCARTHTPYPNTPTHTSPRLHPPPHGTCAGKTLLRRRGRVLRTLRCPLRTPTPSPLIPHIHTQTHTSMRLHTHSCPHNFLQTARFYDIAHSLMPTHLLPDCTLPTTYPNNTDLRTCAGKTMLRNGDTGFTPVSYTHLTLPTIA